MPQIVWLLISLVSNHHNTINSDTLHMHYDAIDGLIELDFDTLDTYRHASRPPHTAASLRFGFIEENLPIFGRYFSWLAWIPSRCFGRHAGRCACTIISGIMPCQHDYIKLLEDTLTADEMASFAPTATMRHTAASVQIFKAHAFAAYWPAAFGIITASICYHAAGEKEHVYIYQCYPISRRRADIVTYQAAIHKATKSPYGHYFEAIQPSIVAISVSLLHIEARACRYSHNIAWYLMSAIWWGFRLLLMISFIF